jgi:hypothetical protein
VADLIAAADNRREAQGEAQGEARGKGGGKQAKKEKQEKGRSADSEGFKVAAGKLYALGARDVGAAGVAPASSSTTVSPPRAVEPEESQRQRAWAALGGQRAVGPEWLPRNPLSWHARTETECVYDSDRKPVHRRAWVAKGKASF